MPGIVGNAWLIPALPLFGATVLLFLGRRMTKAAGAFATFMLTASFTVGLVTFFSVVQNPAGDRTFVQTLYTWIGSGSFRVAADFRIDPLSLIMILVVTGVGAMIHLYSIGYMHGDPRESRYFAYLNLFAASMLILVMANNFLVMYVGWELVGMCSYLLIGFWFERPSAATAAKKAFITNRVGDVGFALGIMLIFTHFHTLDFGRVFGAAPGLANGVATAIALLLFLGATGKSAQIPLYVWLPDAMEGPTPVSALIHAATMVTAGVYMVARTHAIFDASSSAGNVVAIIGVSTALLAAFIAFAQDDIKRVLAYSTISQLGYMFLAVGVGAYGAGVFHLFTHAFFKALLFLGAGSVMHAMANETDMTKMGGLARKLPWTATTFVLGWLAIIGFPGFSGFFSKDQILEGVYNSGNTTLWILALVATFGTGFYMSRLVFLTFFSKPRWAAHAGVSGNGHGSGSEPRESPPVMIWPLALLGIAAALAGLAGLSPAQGRVQSFLAPSLPHCNLVAVGRQPTLELHSFSQCVAEGPNTIIAGPLVPERCPEERSRILGTCSPGLSSAALSAIATGVSLAGAAVAGYMYLGAFDWQRRRERASVFWKVARNKFFVDQAYEFVFVGIGRVVASALAWVVDLKVIDGAVNGLGTGMTALATGVRRLQTGLVRTYALGLLGGTVLIGLFLIVRTR